jgi:hypothetical protein
MGRIDAIKHPARRSFTDPKVVDVGTRVHEGGEAIGAECDGSHHHSTDLEDIHEPVAE